MHDSIFQREINAFSIEEIYLKEGFRSSYFFIPLGVFFHENGNVLLSCTFNEFPKCFSINLPECSHLAFSKTTCIYTLCKIDYQLPYLVCSQ